MNNDLNVIHVTETDRKFIKDLIQTSDRKKILLKGIEIGLDLEESKRGLNPDEYLSKPDREKKIG